MCSGECRDLMSDVQNCGACGNVCASGLPCTSGVCVDTLFSDQTIYGLFVTDDGSLFYWYNQNAMWYAGVNGSQKYDGILISDALYALRAWQLYDGYLYWTSKTDATIRRCSAGAGCADSTIVAVSDGGVSQLVTDGQLVYWGDNSGLKSVPVTGGSPTLVANESAISLAVDDTTLYWGETISLSEHAIHECPKSGCTGSPTTYFDDQPFPTWISSDNTYVYWAAESGTMTMDRCTTISCPNAPTAIETQSDSTSYPLADDVSIYWARPGPNDVVRIPKAGGSAVTVVPTSVLSGDGVASLAIDSMFLYVATGEGRILKFAK